MGVRLVYEDMLRDDGTLLNMQFIGQELRSETITLPKGKDGSLTLKK